MTKLAEDSMEMERLREELRLRRKFSMKAICARYGISRQTANRVLRGMLSEPAEESGMGQFVPKSSQR